MHKKIRRLLRGRMVGSLAGLKGLESQLETQYRTERLALGNSLGDDRFTQSMRAKLHLIITSRDVYATC